ncbi:MAG: RagB/SusD family nutrient uptake outer membrane protein [Paraprevotella sp.]|nr:RagB/SusD family nutrient uptake outer membrane protein [Paraprevotella sp.]
MKRNILNLTLGLFALLTLGACDDFLDIQPVGKVIPTTGSDFRALLTNTYSEVPKDRGLATFRTDEIVLDLGSASTEDINSYFDIWTWNDLDPAGTTTEFNWQRYYHILYVANYIMEQQASMTNTTTAERNQMVGEAYMLRAYMHFLLVNLYAEPYTHCDPTSTRGIPLKLDCDINKVLSRNTVEEVYQSILSDIQRAQQYLNKEQWEEGYTYRFNVISAEALRARTYLYMGEWKKAYDAALKVLDFNNQLEDISTSKVLPNSYKSVESILALEWIMPAQYHAAGRVEPALLSKYKSGDLRKSKFYKQITASNTNALKAGNNEFRCTFRSAEFYLIAAESALENNDMENALNYLTALMKKRYHSSMYSKYETEVKKMTQEQLRQEIQDERLRELAYEGHRWFDLRRTTQPSLTKTYVGTEYTLEAGDSRYTLRFPSAAIAANPGLAQD